MSIRIAAVISALVASLVGLPGCLVNTGVLSTGTLPASQPANRSPLIQSFTANPGNQVAPGQAITFLAIAHDDDGDNLQFNWSTTAGTLNTNAGQAVSWTPPIGAGTYTVQVVVTDGRGGVATGSQNLTVTADKATLAPPTISSPVPSVAPSVTAVPLDSGAGASASSLGAGRWLVQSSGVDSTLRALWFHDAKRGVVVGDKGTVLTTNDSGTTWVQVKSDAMADDALTDVTFVDENVGWVVSSTGRVFQTVDGGSTWRMAHKADGQLTSIRFASPNVGFAAGGLLVLKTVDAGKTWNPEQIGVPGDVTFAEGVGDNVWFGWRNGLMKFNPNAGWERQDASFDRADGSDGTDVSTFDASFSSPSVGWVAVASPLAGRWQFAQTEDGGRSWRVAETRTARKDEITMRDVTGIDFDDPAVGWVLGYAYGAGPENQPDGPTPWSAMLVTRDGGLTWTRHATGALVAGYVQAFEMVDQTTGWAVGADGVIYCYVGEQRFNPISAASAGR